MTPCLRSSKILEHWPEIVLEILGHFLRLKHMDEPVEKLVRSYTRDLCFAFILVRAGCPVWHVVQVLIEKLVQAMIFGRELQDLLIIDTLNVDGKQFFREYK